VALLGFYFVYPTLLLGVQINAEMDAYVRLPLCFMQLVALMCLGLLLFFPASPASGMMRNGASPYAPALLFRKLTALALPMLLI
jgi:hypothetical protein